MTMLDGACECCSKDKPLVGVASIPGMPVSIAWCRDCLDAMVIPYWAAVANTAMCGGLQHCNSEWRGWVERTLAYFDKTPEQFDKDVAEDIVRVEQITKDYEAQREADV